MNLYPPKHLNGRMSVESVVVGASSGGLAGALLTFVFSKWYEQKRERTLRIRICKQVAYELAHYQGHVDLMRAGAVGEYIQSHSNSTIVREGDKMRSSFEFNNLPTELKVNCFKPPLLAQIRTVYREIDSVEIHRRPVLDGMPGAFDVKVSYLKGLSDKIANLQHELTMAIEDRNR